MEWNAVKAYIYFSIVITTMTLFFYQINISIGPVRNYYDAGKISVALTDTYLEDCYNR